MLTKLCTNYLSVANSSCKTTEFNFLKFCENDALILDKFDDWDFHNDNLATGYISTLLPTTVAITIYFLEVCGVCNLFSQIVDVILVQKINFISYFVLSSNCRRYPSQLIAININLIDCRWEINLYDVTVDIEEAGSSPVSAMTWVFSNLLAFRVSEKYCGQVIITGQISQSLGFKKSSTVIAMNFQHQHEPFVSWHKGWNNSTIRSSWPQKGSSNTLLKQLWHDSGF